MRGAWLLLVSLSCGCDAVLGIRDLPRRGEVVDAGEDIGPPISPSCVACETVACDTARAACTREPACNSLYKCLRAQCAPGDPACRAQCEQSNDVAANGAVYRELDLCRRASCAADCYGGSGFGAALNPSCGCMDKHCAKQMLACVASGVATKKDAGACERRLACLAEQPTPDGFIECVGQHGGAVEADALLDCMRKASCTDATTKKACPLGEGELACTSNFVYGRTRAPDVAFTFGVEDFEGKPVVGAKVTACNPPVCAKGCAGVSDLTKADGRVTLRVPMANGGFDGCVHVDPPIEYMPVNVMTGRRIHFDEASLLTLALQEDLFSLYAVQAGVDLIPGRGHVIVSIHDCLWGRVSGASLNELPGAKLAYLDGVTVVPSGMATTATGAAAYVNVEPGPHELTVTKNGAVIARQTIVVRAGELTDANIYPLAK
jgi:hypothetical protein